MKILILTDVYGPSGGAGAIAYYQSCALSREHTVLVLAAEQPRIAGNSSPTVRSFSLSYPRYWRTYRGIYNPPAVRVLDKEIDAFNPDCAIVHNIHTSWSYASLSLLADKKIPAIAVFHDVVAFTPYTKLCSYSSAGEHSYRYPLWKHFREARRTFPNPLRPFFVRKHLMRARARIAVSNALFRALRDNNIPVDSTIHNGIPIPHGLPHSSFSGTILFAGRATTHKGIQLLPSYLARLRGTYGILPHIRITGDKSPAIQAMLNGAKRLNVQNAIRLTGWLNPDQYHKELSSCSVLIAPSVCFDSFPTVLLEAMAYGKPVIASPFGGAPEIVNHAKTGFIVNPFDVPSMANALFQIINNPRRAQEMGTRGRERLSERFQVEKQIEKLLSFL